VKAAHPSISQRCGFADAQKKAGQSAVDNHDEQGKGIHAGPFPPFRLPRLIWPFKSVAEELIVMPRQGLRS
jgi:hypothetical protein